MEGPIYKLAGFDGKKKQEIVIDVTRSAQPFTVPGEPLKSVLEKVLRNKKLGISDVVEFGAGKLKNVPFLLKQGVRVTAVEFEENTRSPVARRNLEKSQAYGAKFRFMTPGHFTSDGSKFDLALLANVIQTVPLKSERVEIMQLMNEKLRKGKFLLWFAMKEHQRYVSRRNSGKTCEDGVWLGDGQSFHTFYKYHSPEEAIVLAQNSGFVPFDRFRPQTNHALLFMKV